ncbi:5'-nucleotidase C-terminal domain-containing protein [Psychrobacillus psychrodurans]|uniref:5'-nucleotidase C-terminal domain-containing protein n=1 Tax=Psychrobacillus psychrodurans TaxID=126157 RepID=UPI0008E5D212|nr:5'-nucleotidase C-terminal domain-containing protein [Psychrobacillus psychrodurans]MCZ8542275.1 5'-nucleotidase C-terminal domain-containing protein [Psychrobacillus psychrodurans]SFN20251.1 2',3'-cyclic-nucleotide 2'-phosphodiesterase/5'-or 3'-nucleotidase, 5'-nucleotidase family [Psychrobacillus psychrodurans]
MRNSKMKKSAVAVVIATSLFSVSSVSFANSSLQEVVDNARKDIKNSAYSYVVPAQAGKLATSKNLYPALNTAKANYQKARNEIVKSNVKNKDLLLKNLDELYHERVTKGIIPYIDAYNYADKYLAPIMKEIEQAEISKDWDKIEKAYHKLSVQLKTRTAILYRFTGKAPRDLLLEQYKEPANQKRDELIVPVTIFMKAKEAEAYIAANKEQEALKVLESINLLIEKLPSDSSPIIKELLVYVENISEQVKADFTLSLMHVNDTHARTTQAPKRLTAIKEVRAEKPSALLIDAGDVFSGTLYFNEFKGQADLELMKLMDYDVMTFGNHEFDLGSSEEGHKALKEFIEKSNFPFVSSNVDFSKDTNLKGLFNVNVSTEPKDGQIYSGIIKEIDGQKVGLFGLTTAETANISSPKDVTFTDYIKAAQTMVDEFEKQGVNKVVAVTHIGYDDNPTVDNDLLLAAAVNGIDVIVGGHSHTKLEKPVLVEKDSTGKEKDPTIIVQASQYSEFLGTLDVDFDEDGKVVGHAGELIEIKGQVEDPTAATLLKTYSDKIDAINKTEIGVVAEEELQLPRTDGDDTKPSVRKNETALGNIITDGMLSKAKQYDNKVIMALQNGGGIRAEIGQGPITVGEVITVLPFGNTLATMEITGAELKSAFEISFKSYPKENGGFLHVAGAKVEFDSSKPAGERVVSIKYKAADGSFVDIKDGEKYVVATNAFTAKGGDSYDVFEKIYKEGRVTDLGLSDWENLQEQLKTLKTVNNKTEGRIVDVKK